MKKLKSTFQECFCFSIPQIMLLGEKLFPLDGKRVKDHHGKNQKENLVPSDSKSEEALLFGSRTALQGPYLLQGNIGRFIESCPEGYFLIGFWGHGVNSYAFYYSRVDSWSKVFFRLPYGDVYMDNKKMARYIREFLTHYCDFEQELIGKVEKLIAIESMGDGYYEVVMPGGKTFELDESLFGKPNFKEKFGHLFDA